MTKYFLPIFLVFFWSCENEEEQNNFVFMITDQGYFADDFLVLIHDAENPDIRPLASAYVEQGGTVTFNNDNVEGDLINDMNDSIIIDLTNEINLSDFGGSELIVTTGTISNNNYSLISNWHVKKGSEWTMVGDNAFIDGVNDTVNVTIEAPSGKRITNYATDIGDNFRAGFGFSVENITYKHNVSDVGNDNRLNISSVVRLNDGNWYLSYLENRTWARGIGFTIDDWIPDVVYKMNIPIANLNDKSYFYITSSNYSTNYSFLGDRTTWNTYWYRTYEPDTLNGSMEIMTTDAIPFADKKRVYCSFRNDDGYYWSADYGDFQDGDIVSPKNMDLSFSYSGATGTALNISASNDVDQIRFLYNLSDNENGFYSWTHYFDPAQMDRFDIPNLGNQVNLNVDWVANPGVYDYDNFESNADIVKSLFEDNNFSTSWTDRHYNSIPNLTDSQVLSTMNNSKKNNGNTNLYLDKQHGINNLREQFDKGNFH